MSATPRPGVEFQPCAGLANRMRSIVSAMCLASERGIPLQIQWKNDPAIFTAPFHMIFDMSSFPNWVQVQDSVLEPSSLWTRIREVNSASDLMFYERDMGDRLPLRFKSWAKFYTRDDARYLSLLRAIRPTDEIRSRTNALLNPAMADGSTIVGVHVRRTDHKKAIEHSPSDAFWRAMSEFSAGTKFYFASDSVPERNDAVRRFPGQVILAPLRSLDRNNPFGCQDGMLDLYCLSKCSQILGSFGSSFSEMAADWGGVPLRVISE
jgi:hypothetical protein